MADDKRKILIDLKAVLKPFAKGMDLRKNDAR